MVIGLLLLSIVVALVLAIPRVTRSLALYWLLIPLLALVGNVLLTWLLMVAFDRHFGPEGRLVGVLIGYPTGTVLGALGGYLSARRINRLLGWKVERRASPAAASASESDAEDVNTE